mmetsp:Transcript_78188/g.253826  ORF Transcript_78188/g.253826 Transcript_78188/m.253826 type:complete len:574 (+) Transcript_78188:69-1790(+)
MPAPFEAILARRHGGLAKSVALLASLLLLRRLARWLKRYRSTPPVVAKGAPEFLRWSACRLARAIRSQELHAVDIVEASIKVLEGTHDSLNALAWKRFTEARDEAASADARVDDAKRSGQLEGLPEFLGVPIMLKEAFELVGQPYTHGLLSLKGRLGQRNGPVVKRILEGGFVVVGGGNISEACMWMESYNLVYGRSNSPFDCSRTPGGSSGGTCAAVAVLGAPVGITADIGGSTRIPAFFNGLFGHKATGGLIANTHTHLDNFHGAVCRICQPGFVTRHAEDLGPMLRLIAGPPSEEEDHSHREYLPLPRWLASPGPVLPRKPELRGLRVVPLTFRGGWPAKMEEAAQLLISSVSPPLVDAQARIVEWLRAQGCTICPMHFEDLSVGAWFATWADRNQAAGGPTFRQVICNGAEASGPAELLRYALGRSAFTAPALGLAFLEGAVDALSPPMAKRVEAANAIQAKLEAALAGPGEDGGHGVFLMPTLPRHGCKHDELLLRVFDSCFTSIWNAVEFPATSVPVGSAPNGTPLGLQIVSTRGNDELTLGLAVELERAGLAFCTAPGDKSVGPSR